MDELRLPFYVSALDPASEAYGSSDSESDEYEVEREVDFTERANCWSSVDAASYRDQLVAQADVIEAWGMAYDECLHRPVFDVDLPITKPVIDAIEGTFPEPEAVIRWAPSTKWHHCYIDGITLAFEDFAGRLQQLADLSIVQSGYVGATAGRGAAFVRMPHVHKRKEPS